MAVNSRREFLKAGLVLASGRRIAAQTASPPVAARQMSFPERAVRGYQSRFAHGYLVYSNRLARHVGEGPNVGVFRADGTIIYELNLMLPDAVETTVTGIDVNRSGEALVCGLAISKDARIARFLAFLDPRGALTRVVRTNPFQPSAACFGPDGTIWALGQSLSDDTVPAGLPLGGDIVEHYDSKGIRLGAAAAPASSINTAALSSDLVCLRASDDRIGAWLGSENGEWMELDAGDGRVLGRWKTPLPAHADLLASLVYTPTSEVYASIFGIEVSSLYQLDRPSSSWRPVPAFSATQHQAGIARIMGIDAGHLVFRGISGNIVWFPTPSA